MHEMSFKSSIKLVFTNLKKERKPILIELVSYVQRRKEDGSSIPSI